MIVDYLHSFYQMPVRINLGGTWTAKTIRWFKASPGAKVLPFPTCFGSDVWQPSGQPHRPFAGEKGFPRVWDPGVNSDLSPGTCWVGDPEWFLSGEVPQSALAGPTPPVPPCCKPPQVEARGGLILGGAGVPFPGPMPRSMGGLILGGAGVPFPGPMPVGMGGLILGGAGQAIGPGPGPGPNPSPSPSPSPSGGSGSGSGSGGEPPPFCFYCPDGAPRVWMIGTEEFSSPCWPNCGDVPMEWIAGCDWGGHCGELSVSLALGGSIGGGVLVEFGGDAGSGFNTTIYTTSLDLFNCLGYNTLTLYSTTCPLGFPLTVTVFPQP